MLLFHERNNITILNYKGFVHQSFLIFVGVLSFFSFKSPFLIFVFLDFKFCFLLKINVILLKNASSKKTNFGSRGELQHNGFFINLCFAKCEKLSFIGGHFLGPIFVDFQKTL